jgi:hypothetical protein
LKDAEAFFSDPKHQVPGQEVQLGEVADQVNDCVHLREREGAAMVSYLDASSHSTGTHSTAGSPR